MKEKAINMHKRAAMGETGIGFAKGGLISNTKRSKKNDKDADDMKAGGSCGYGKGGKVKGKKK